MEVVDFSGYTEREKAEIAKTYLIPRQLEESGLADERVTFTDEAVMEVVSRYTRESGVRQLERQVGAVARKLARRIAAGEAVEPTVTPERRPRAARPAPGPPRARRLGQRGRAWPPGCITPRAGGDIMFVEAAIRELHGPTAAGGRRPVRRLGERLADPDRPARRRDEGVGPGGDDLRGDPRPRAGDPAGPARLDRGPRPRPGRRDPQGRPLGRRGDGHRDHLGHVGPARSAATSR